MSSVNTRLATVAAMSLDTLDNLTLSALNNAVQGFGRVDPGNIAFEQCKKFGLIREDGVPFDLESLKTAAAFVVNQRVKAGTFN